MGHGCLFLLLMLLLMAMMMMMMIKRKRRMMLIVMTWSAVVEGRAARWSAATESCQLGFYYLSEALEVHELTFVPSGFEANQWKT